MNSYKNLAVWEKSMDLVEEVYRICTLLPKDERYALSDQLRRGVVSIPSNIAEGYGRNGMKEYARFLNIARGSKYEVETKLLICTRLHFILTAEISKAMNMCSEIGKMLNAMIKKLSS